jgi:hypothetical protein
VRLWSLHPKYLDRQGLVALWREALLARRVLEGRTKGYTRHPQLTRFRKAKHPMDCINQYLTAVYEEAAARGYHFDGTRIRKDFIPTTLTVTSGQLLYEINHLTGKLKIRDPLRYNELKGIITIDSHPLFQVTEGEVEEWEIIGKPE